MKSNNSCQLCGFKAMDDGKMIEHLSKCWAKNFGVHASTEDDGKNSYFKCVHCSQKFFFVEHLKEHLQKEHSEQRESLQEKRKKHVFLNPQSPLLLNPPSGPKMLPTKTHEKQSSSQSIEIIVERKHAKRNEKREKAIEEEFDHTKLRRKKETVPVNEEVIYFETKPIQEEAGGMMCSYPGCRFSTHDDRDFAAHQNKHISDELHQWEIQAAEKEPELDEYILHCARPTCYFTTFNAQQLLEHEQEHSKNNMGKQKCIFCAYNGHKSQMREHYRTAHQINFQNGLTVRDLKKGWLLREKNTAGTRQKFVDIREQYRNYFTQEGNKQIPLKKNITNEEIEAERPHLKDHMPEQVADLEIQLQILNLAAKNMMKIHDKWEQKKFRSQFQKMMEKTEYLRNQFKNPFLRNAMIERAIQFGWLTKTTEVSETQTQWYESPLKKRLESRYIPKRVSVVIKPGQNLNWHYFHLLQASSMVHIESLYRKHSLQRILYYKSRIAETLEEKNFQPKKETNINKEGKVYEVKKKSRNVPLASEEARVFANNYSYCFLKRQLYEAQKKQPYFRHIVLEGVWLKTLKQRSAMDRLVGMRQLDGFQLAEIDEKRLKQENCQKFGLLNFQELRKFDATGDISSAKKEIKKALDDFPFGQRLKSWADMNSIKYEDLQTITEQRQLAERKRAERKQDEKRQAEQAKAEKRQAEAEKKQGRKRGGKK